MTVQLQFTLRRGYHSTYQVETVLSRSDDTGDVLTTGSLAADFDPAKLPPLSDPSAYGLAVGSALLSDEAIRRALEDATVAAQDDALRVRLNVQGDAAGLYSVAWEMAHDPRLPNDPRGRLFAGERRVFARFISSGDPRPLYRRAYGEFNVLVAIASPTNISEYVINGMPLPDIEQELELGRIEEALAGSATVAVLRSSEAPVTLDKIIEELTNDFDVLYLICHGNVDTQGTPLLYLQGEDGSTNVVQGEDFVRRVCDIRERPRLIVLGSCKSSGEAGATVYGARGAFVTLGPRLAEAGIPAVLAMQGDISIETVNKFVPAFLKQLGQQGSVDRAVSLARSELVDDFQDWWIPTLITRLRTGEIFRRTGFDGGDDNFQNWNDLIAAIASRTCTPILGPALLEWYVGSRRELAARVARAFNQRPPRGDRDLLALVAQQLGMVNSAQSIRRELLLAIVGAVADRYRGLVPQELLEPLTADADSSVLVERVRRVIDVAVTKQGDRDPHRLIAKLPLPIFITTNADDILARALVRDRNVAPEVEVHRWNAELQDIESVFDREPNYKPTEARPLIYHFFGSAEHQESIAVTQDHFVDALVAASRKDTSNVPTVLSSALTRTTLLFMGFQLDDWAFRAFFRYIINQQGANLLRGKNHVAVQVDPEESEFDDPEVARRNIARYLGDERIRIYWGSVGDFLLELDQRRTRPAVGGPLPPARGALVGA